MDMRLAFKINRVNMPGVMPEEREGFQAQDFKHQCIIRADIEHRRRDPGSNVRIPWTFSCSARCSDMYDLIMVLKISCLANK